MLKMEYLKIPVDRPRNARPCLSPSSSSRKKLKIFHAKSRGCVCIFQEKKKVGLYIKSINDIGMNYETKMSQQNEIIAYT